jgi:LytR cell envelope-related transcriptional attenuator
MMPLMEAVTALEAHGETPPLAAARMRRQLTVESAAKLARLTPEEVSWLEEGRLYRFPSSDSALLALLLYSTGLGISRREARRLAGLPVITRPGRERMRQATGMLVGVVVVVAAAGAFVLPGLVRGASKPPTAIAEAGLPPTWKVSVDVLNGSGDMNYTRSVASKIGALAYRIDRVSRADRFDYPETAVYFHPGGEQLAARLARQLGVGVRPLPGAGNARRLVVVVGPARI